MMTVRYADLAKFQADALRFAAHVHSDEYDESDALAGLLVSAQEAGIDTDDAEHIFREALAGREAVRPPIAINYDDFIANDFPPRELMLSPWLPVKGSAMIHAHRGIGKTHVALGVAWAIATGRGFLKWEAVSGARRVLLLDGEMPCTSIKERLERVIARSQYKPPLPDYLRIAAADYRLEGLPDLANLEQQEKFYGPLVADADLVIVDNLSTICRGLKENDADSYVPVQHWVLSLRRQNKSVLLIHHDGKGGQQRGTSRKEDVLDSVIGLRRPFDYTASQGARFEVHFEKNRGFHGEEAEPFEAWLQGDQWAVSPIKCGDDADSLRKMKDSGLSFRQIAERTGMPKSTVERRLNGGGDAVPVGHF